MEQHGKFVLVLGATGQQGGSMAAALNGEGWSVRALVCDPASGKARALAASGVEVVRGNLEDAQSLRAAMTGAYGVFSVQPSSGQGAAYGVSDDEEIRYGTTVAALATECGVRHLVYSSANAAGSTKTGVGHFDTKSVIEDYVRSVDVPSTSIRPSAFMEILLLPGLGLDEGRLTFFMRPDQPMQFIAVEDIGRIVARVFEEPETFRMRTIKIAGDAGDAGDENDVARAFSEAAGRPITYQRFPAELLSSDRFLGSLASLVDEGRLFGRADIDALRRKFPGLLTMCEWLKGSGREAFERALRLSGQAALRGLDMSHPQLIRWCRASPAEKVRCRYSQASALCQSCKCSQHVIPHSWYIF